MTLATYLADGYGIDFTTLAPSARGLTWSASCVWWEVSRGEWIDLRIDNSLLSSAGAWFTAIGGRGAEVREEPQKCGPCQTKERDEQLEDERGTNPCSRWLVVTALCRMSEYSKRRD